MTDKLKILVLIRKIWEYAKHRPKMEMVKTLEKFADVYYWHEDGHIDDILKKIKITPDFIFHYDIAWLNGLAPKIEGLGNTNIATGSFVIDLHWEPKTRIQYFEDNHIDIIFSVTKNPFLKVFPQYEEKLCWLPWSINPDIMKDYELKKDIDALLMGLVYLDSNNRGKHRLPKKLPYKDRYAFRDAVFRKMKDRDDFVFHPHPGHRVKDTEKLMVNERYAKELNRSKIFFTCGSRSEHGGVAVLKFFEAPACNTLLLAETNQDIEDLGFVDGENFVACTIENVVNKADYYLANEQERKRISENGYQFVHHNHTNEMRAKQMIQEIKQYLLIR
ncbi:glycosyltransferase family protein [Pseudogracilibacillus sp. SO30301A]|uniref:glycosyltransferase family protein n=1 Tax=Pseudogracilibacillus sp. SO30301A TaxID=3098291 RepID=UPI00300DCB3C